MDTLAKARPRMSRPTAIPMALPTDVRAFSMRPSVASSAPGFHRTTMQDVAAEAGMSPGNLYRYFPSKDAIVAGLAERDRARVMADFAEHRRSRRLRRGLPGARAQALRGRAARAGGPVPGDLGRGDPQSGFRGARRTSSTATSMTRMVALFRQAQERGLIAAAVDLDALATLISTMADGLFVRRAVVAGLRSRRAKSPT